MLYAVLVVARRYRVKTAGVKGLTAPEPPDCKPATPDQAVAVDGFQRVTGTTRVKPALVADKGAEQQLVKPYEAPGADSGKLND